MTIYCLIDPITWDVMYVGKTTNTGKRYGHHVSLAVNSRYKSTKGDWIRYLREFHDLKPIMQILTECIDAVSHLYEHIYFKLFGGYKTLTNTATIFKETYQYEITF
jgi:hypothetical protein